MYKGKDRWSMIDENTWGMILGKSGQLLGELGPDIKKLAEKQNREYYNGVPQDLYPDELDTYRKLMDEKGWDYGQDDEELLEYAMHPQQYEALKSGEAKAKFLADLEERKNKKKASVTAPVAAVAAPTASYQPKSLDIVVNGDKYKVKISYPDGGGSTAQDNVAVTKSTEEFKPPADGPGTYVLAPLEGKFFLTKNSSETAKKIGDVVKEGDTIAYIEAMKVINAITADQAGTITEIYAGQGDEVEEDDKLFKLA